MKPTIHPTVDEFVQQLNLYNSLYNRHLARAVYDRYATDKLMIFRVHNSYMFYYDQNVHSIQITKENIIFINDHGTYVHIAPLNLDFNISVQRDFDELTKVS